MFFIYILHINLIRCVICKNLLPFCGLSFNFLDGVPWNTERFYFWWCPIYIFFSSVSFGAIPKKPLSSPMSWRFMTVFLSKSLVILAYIWANFCIWCDAGFHIHTLRVDKQLSQHHLVKRLLFPHWIVSEPLLKINWLCIWGFISESTIWFHWSRCQTWVTFKFPHTF